MWIFSVVSGRPEVNWSKFDLLMMCFSGNGGVSARRRGCLMILRKCFMVELKVFQKAESGVSTPEF